MGTKVFPDGTKVLLGRIATFADHDGRIQSSCGHQNQNVRPIAERKHNIGCMFLDRRANRADSISRIEKLGGQTSALDHQIKSVTDDVLADCVTLYRSIVQRDQRDGVFSVGQPRCQRRHHTFGAAAVKGVNDANDVHVFARWFEEGRRLKFTRAAARTGGV